MIWSVYVSAANKFGYLAGTIVGPCIYYERNIRRVARATVPPFRALTLVALGCLPFVIAAQMTPQELTRAAQDHETRLRQLEESSRDTNALIREYFGAAGRYRQMEADIASVRVTLASTTQAIAEARSAEAEGRRLTNLLIACMGLLSAVAFGILGWVRKKGTTETGEKPVVR